MKTSTQQHSWHEENQGKKAHKIADEYLEYGCGFPVRLINVPIIEDDGVWIPAIDYNKLDKLVLLEICKMPCRLTGDQIRFIRLYFEKTLEEFAQMFRVKHSSVIHWEKQKSNSAKITWGTELAVRLFVLYRLDTGAKKFQQDYAALMELEMSKSGLIQIDATRI